MEDLPPWAQAQAQKKMAEQSRKKEPAPPAWAESKEKYHNVRTDRTSEAGGRVNFDSKKEARRYDELMAMLRAGEDPGPETAAAVHHPGGLHDAGGAARPSDPVPGGLLLQAADGAGLHRGGPLAAGGGGRQKPSHKNPCV